MRKTFTYILMGILGGILAIQTASAGTINVLWYSGGVQDYDNDYQADIGELAALAPGAPGGNTWNVTFWDSGPMPAGSFNVMVVADPVGGWSPYPDYSALNAALAGGIAFGDRIMLTGQDTDYHWTQAEMTTPFDGPQGFFLDSINWAGSGKGMGLVALALTGQGNDCFGYSPTPNFGFSGYSSNGCGGTENVQIPPEYASYPINTGLTSGGLSNWGTSAHDQFSDLDPTKWTGINLDGNSPGMYVTIVSADTGGGGITTTPEPCSAVLFASLLGLAFNKLRKRL